MMNLFKKKARSPSFDFPSFCMPARQKRSGSVDVSASRGKLEIPIPQRGRSSSFDVAAMHALNPSLMGILGVGLQERANSEDIITPLSDDQLSVKSNSSNKSGRSGRRRSSVETPKPCVHCLHEAQEKSDPNSPERPSEIITDPELSSESCSSDDEDSDPASCDGNLLEVRQNNEVIDSNENVKTVVTLAVPNLKEAELVKSLMPLPFPVANNQPRRASFDVSMLQHSSKEDFAASATKKPQAADDLAAVTRKKSKSFLKAIAKSPFGTSNTLLHPDHAEYSYCKKHEKQVRADMDWSENAINGDHIWYDSTASSDWCYVGEHECMKNGPRKKCSACKIVVHIGCMSQLERINFRCKPTFREAGIRNYREHTVIRHHWVHRRRQEGKCKQCGKSFQQKFAFHSKEIIAISCSWCKAAYHNKTACFMMQQIQEQCPLGIHGSIIVPPSWIIKIPKRGSFKSSIRRKKRASLKKRKSKEDYKPFIIKHIPSPIMKPLLLFINPKSGGNQGARLLHKFRWLLNPRQVFDLSQTGPRMALELYKKVPNLRILACGGDGTVGWILSTIDLVGIKPPPPVAVLPLGTGNDLARTLNWGSVSLKSSTVTVFVVESCLN